MDRGVWRIRSIGSQRVRRDLAAKKQLCITLIVIPVLRYSVISKTLPFMTVSLSPPKGCFHKGRDVHLFSLLLCLCCSEQCLAHNKVKVFVAQLGLTFCDPMDLPGPSVHGISQARILGGHSLLGDLPYPGTKPWSLALQADSLLSEPRGKPAWHIVGTQYIPVESLNNVCWLLLYVSTFWTFWVLCIVKQEWYLFQTLLPLGKGEEIFSESLIFLKLGFWAGSSGIIRGESWAWGIHCSHLLHS